jgi:hypothetical protein
MIVFNIINFTICPFFIRTHKISFWCYNLIDKNTKDYIIYYELISLPQGERMSKINNIDLIGSVLTVKASGSIAYEVAEDLELSQGKNIAELINDQEKTPKNTDQH